MFDLWRSVTFRAGFVNLMDQLEQLTENNSVVNLTIAINYGGEMRLLELLKGWQRMS